MIKSEKKLRELELILSRNNSLKITEEIGHLRDNQPFEGAIGLLVSYYSRSSNESIKKLISNFMNDLKYQSASAEIMKEIRRETLPETLRMLVSSCWQSGLDYSQYSVEFANIFLRTEDYMTAVECFSVLESSTHKMSRKKKDEIIKMVRDDNSVKSDSRYALSTELIAVLTL